MAESICAGVTHRETEFALVNPTTRVYGACGPCALASVAANAGAVPSPVHTKDVYWFMNQRGLCDSEGVTTLANLGVAADKMGLTTLARRNYTDPPWDGWQAFFTQFAGAAPFVAQVGFGQQLVDVISGDGENAVNLRSHFICVLGRNTGGWSPRANRNLPSGFWVADGCNFAGGNSNANDFNAADVLQFYPDNVMGAALPTGALVIKGVQKMAWTQQPDGSGKDDLGNTCGAGSYQELVTLGKLGVDGRASETHYTASGVADAAYLPLADGTVIHAVQRAAGGAWTQDTNAAQVVIDLQLVIDGLKKAPPASDPLAEEALADVKALKLLIGKLP